MEFAQEGSLKNFIDKWRRGEVTVTWKDALHGIMHLLQALQYLHNCHEKHKDINPANILVYRDPTTGETVMKLADLGLTRNHEHSQSNKGAGTLQFMALEIVNRKPSQYASDIFSFALTAGILISGGKPMPEFRGRPKEKQRAKMHDWMHNPPSPFLHETGFELLQETLFSCLDDNYENRPDVSALLDIVTTIINGY